MESLEEKELSQDQLRSLILEAKEKGEEEAKFILILQTNHRPGPSYVDESKFTVIKGKIKKVLLEHIYDYPTTDAYTYAIIPLTVPVIIMFEHEYDWDGPGLDRTLYVFTGAEWKRLELTA